MNKRSMWFVVIAFALSVPVVVADTGLFVGETPVADEGSATRNAALSELLAAVLTRVSGTTNIAAQPAAKDILASAPSLVQQYRYRTVDYGGKVARYLWARFDQSAVERMMRERNLPVWVQRPRVLLWVATERAGKRVLLNFETRPEVRAAALARAQRRGMPLQLPLMDIEDQGKLTPADLWSDYQQGIRQASARYPHDAILAGRLSARRGKQWTGAWSLIDRDGSHSFQTPPSTLADSLAAAVDQAQDRLAARYAPLPIAGGSTGTLVRFSEVYDLAAYGRLVALLDGLRSVAQVALRGANRDSFLFEMRLQGSEQDLVRALELSGQVVLEPGPVHRSPAAPQTGLSDIDAGHMAAEPAADLYFRLLY